LTFEKEIFFSTAFYIMAKVQIIVFGLMLMMACTVFGTREWYCKLEKDKFQICHKNKDGIARSPSECRCENMKFVKNDGSYELYGGPEQCNDPNDAFCFVSEDSNCGDLEDEYGNKFSSVNDRIENIWSDKEIWYSNEACVADYQDDNVGNQELLEGIKIKGDRILEVADNGIDLGPELEFDMEDWEECQGECLARQGNCGAWSFDKEEESCYLHTVESCCGQFGKRARDPNWVSGYVCHKCWSTKRGTDCPCPIEERTMAPKTAHGAGGRAPLHATSSGSLTVQSVNVARNACKCKPRRTQRGRIKCRKPFCAEPGDEKGCQDKRKCRLKRKKGNRGRRSLMDLLHL